MPPSTLYYSLFSRRVANGLAALMLVFLAVMTHAAPRVALSSRQPEAVATATALGRVASNTTVSLALALPLRHQGDLADLLRGLYDAQDPRCGQFLTPAQFVDRFGPTPADYEAVAAFARRQGLTVTGTHPNRLLLDVAGPAQAVEAAFGVRLNQYRATDGRLFRVADAAPSVPAALAGRVAGVVGLDTASVRRPAGLRPRAAALPAGVTAHGGSGPGGGLSPSDIKTAYNLSAAGATGTGQTLALFELDGYAPSDIAAYKTKFGLPDVPVQPVLVDGYDGHAGPYTAEVCLDIELQIALAPGASRVLVYEAPLTGVAVLDTYNRIAADNLAQQVSTSWGLYEGGSDTASLNAENAIFQQMAAQGQTVYAAAGDSGAYDNKTTLCVDDPASQPYVTGVGGTTLSTGSGGSYRSESTWNWGSANDGAGGGGVSAVWPKPDYQAGVGASATMRNVPDVSLDSDPDTGYAIYVSGHWGVYAGTSAAAPLWAAFTALVNQQRAAAGRARLGFANPVLYRYAGSNRYAQDFHDIADNSNNLFFAATPGYDNATGWGTINGAGLLADLAAAVVGPDSTPPTTTAVPAGPAGANGWFVGPVQVTLSANDPDGPSDVAATYVSVNGGAAQSYGGPLTLSADGTYSVTFWSVDRAGNAESPNTLAVKIDATVPSTGDVVRGTQVTLSGSDALSGLAATLYTVDGGTAQTYTAPFSVTGVGNHAVSFWSVDLAGNSERPNGVTVTVSAPSQAAPGVLHVFSAGLQMISAPKDFSRVSLGQALDGIHPTLAVWDPTLLQYALTPTAPADALRPGQGYWVKFAQSTNLLDLGTATPTDHSFQLTLHRGWNMIGNPFPASLPLSSVTLQAAAGGSSSLPGAVGSGVVGTSLYTFPAGATDYQTVSTADGSLEPYQGYWLYAAQDSTLLLPPPAGASAQSH